MTKRSLDASIVSELGNVFLKPVQFLELRFDSGTVYLHERWYLYWPVFWFTSYFIWYDERDVRRLIELTYKVEIKR